MMRLVPASGRLVTLALAILITACASTAASPRSPRTSSNLIGAEELAAATQSSLLEVVQVLRPQWLRTSPATFSPDGGGDVVVYFDGQRVGFRDALRQYHPSMIAQMRYYSPSEAQSRFGLGHLHGAILITPRTGR